MSPENEALPKKITEQIQSSKSDDSENKSESQANRNVTVVWAIDSENPLSDQLVLTLNSLNVDPKQLADFTMSPNGSYSALYSSTGSLLDANSFSSYSNMLLHDTSIARNIFDRTGLLIKVEKFPSSYFSAETYCRKLAWDMAYDFSTIIPSYTIEMHTSKSEDLSYEITTAMVHFYSTMNAVESINDGPHQLENHAVSVGFYIKVYTGANSQQTVIWGLEATPFIEEHDLKIKDFLEKDLKEHINSWLIVEE